MTRENPPDTSPRARFGIRFSILARHWRQAIERQLAEAGLTDATWVPLVHLKETGGGIAQKTLAQLVGVDGSSLVRVLDILSREGLVERRADPSDGRARLIHLTEAGEARVARIREELGRVEMRLLADLSDAELAGMLERFARIDARLTGEDGPGADLGRKAGVNRNADSKGQGNGGPASKKMDPERRLSERKDKNR